MVFAIEFANELNDSIAIWLDNIHHQPVYDGWDDNISDFIWTMMVPTIIAVLVSLWRYRQRSKFAGRVRPY
jgi:hypothetical protein